MRRAEAKPISLYERLGADWAVMAVVPIFYARVLDDELLQPFFQNTDIQSQIRKMIAFVTVAFGGPSGYGGRDLEAAHGRSVSMGLRDEHFDAFKGHLENSLKRLGADDATIEEAVTVMESHRETVLGRVPAWATEPENEGP